LKTGDGILRAVSPVAAGSAPWFLEDVNWFSFNDGQQARKAPREPRMLMKIKQVSEESKRSAGLLQKTKCLKLNRLLISVVGYHKAEK